MQNLTRIFFIVFLSFGSISVNGQAFLKRIEEKAKQKAKEKTTERIEKKVDEKIDEKIDKTLDKVFEKEEKKNTTKRQSQSNSFSNKLLKSALGGEHCKVKPSYSFQHNYLAEMGSVAAKSKKVEKIKMRMYMASDVSLFAYTIIENSQSAETKGSTFVLDTKDSSMVMLMNVNGNKTAICIKTHPSEDMEIEDEEMNDEQKNKANGWVKTGKTKTILGKKCYEYIKNTETTNQIAWIASDGKSMAELMKAMNRSKQTGFSNNADNPYGFMMEMTTIDNGSGDKVIFRMLELNENKPKTISTSGYSTF